MEKVLDQDVSPLLKPKPFIHIHCTDQKGISNDSPSIDKIEPRSCEATKIGDYSCSKVAESTQQVIVLQDTRRIDRKSIDNDIEKLVEENDLVIKKELPCGEFKTTRASVVAWKSDHTIDMIKEINHESNFFSHQIASP